MVEDLLEKHREFIAKIAKKYAHKHSLLDYEDLVAEANYVLVKVFRHVYDEEDFEKVFCYSVANHFKNILSDLFREKRVSILISLDEAIELAGPDVFEEIYFREKLGHLKLLLNSRQLSVLEELMNPGFKTSEGDPLVKTEHIACALKLTTSQVTECMSYIRSKLHNGLKDRPVEPEPFI